MEQQNKKYVILDKTGKIICLINNKIEYKNLKDIKNKDEIFLFWSCNIEEFKDFVTAFEAFSGSNPFKTILTEEISFLEMEIEEDGSIVFS